ncbi:uncharacterized protein LOC122387427 [Amphibalanus amphitrite]|uniref:uncharacterized protein LOC122387427 n=1 Tax=Amphibalanus amphitrite TaxID=1232801 RepID=UPI001C9159EC|nr:uncharacterized protein LOC122387427 [Amphibalanus amphitrite]
MQKWLFLFHVSLGFAEEFFPDKTSVITNEHLAFYQRKDFYLITVPCAVAALFLICCVLCCTLYAREGVCHLFDFPEELRRHASGEHFLTVDEFLELERRHRLGLPVESLLELEKKRRSEAGAGNPQLDGDQPVAEEGWPQSEGDADTWAQPQDPPTSDAAYMSGQSDARVASSLADMRSPQAQWSAPRMRRSMSLDRATNRGADELGSRPGQYAIPTDAPASPGASPMQYDAPPQQQGSEFPRQTPPGDRREPDPTTGQLEAGRTAPETAPNASNPADDARRAPADDPRYPADYRRPSQPQDSFGADRGYPRRSDPELSRRAAERDYDPRGVYGGPGRPPDGYDQWSLRDRPYDGGPPPPETYDRSPHLADKRDSRNRDPADRPPLGVERPGVDRQLTDRQGPEVGRRYSGLQRYSSPPTAATGGRRVSSRDGAIMPPSGDRTLQNDYKTDIPPSARGDVYSAGAPRQDLPPKGGLDDPRQRVYPPEDPLRPDAGRNAPRDAPHQYVHSDRGYPDESRQMYADRDLQHRAPSGGRLVYDEYDYPPHDANGSRYADFPDSRTRLYDDPRGPPGGQRYDSDSRGMPQQQGYDAPEQVMQYDRPVSRRASQAYEYVDQGYAPHPDVRDGAYRRGEGAPSRVSSQGSLSYGRRSDERFLPPQQQLVDSFGRPISNGTDMREPRGIPPRPPDYPGRSVPADRAESRQWVTGADGRRYLAPVSSGRSATAPSTPRQWSGVQSPRMEFRADGPGSSRIFGNTIRPVPVGIYGETVDINGPDMSGYDNRDGQKPYDDRYMEDPRRRENDRQDRDDRRALNDPYGRSEETRPDQQPAAPRPSGLLQRVRSVSVSRMSHSLRQMVAGKQQPSSRSRSEEPRDLAGDSPRGSAAWLLHRIRSLRGVSEQPTVSSRSSQRRRQERRTDRLNRSHGPQDSLTGSEGAVSGAADWPSSVEDLEEGEYVSPSRRDGEGSRHPTPLPAGQDRAGLDEEFPTELQTQSPRQGAESDVTKPPDEVSAKQPSPKPEPVQYVLEEHDGRKRIVAVATDLPEADQFVGDALEPPAGDQRAVSDYSGDSDEDAAKKKGQKKRKVRSAVKHLRSDESANSQTKRKKSKAKKKKKKHSRKRSKSSRSTSSSSSSSYEKSTKRSKRHSASLCGDSDQSDSDDSDYDVESYEDSQVSLAEHGRRLARSGSRDSHRSANQRRYQAHRDNRFSERSMYGQQDRRPYQGHHHHSPRPSPAPGRSRWDSGSPGRGGPARSETPPDRELTPDRGRSELNRHGQPRHRPVVFQNESLRSFVSQPPRRAFVQRGRPPRTGRGAVPAWMRRPFQTNQSFMWQQYPESPQRGRARGSPTGHQGPRTPPLPSPPPGPDRQSPSTTPPRPPPRPGPAVRADPRTRPARDPRLCAARTQAAREAAARECQMRRAVLGETSREEVGCTSKLKRFFDE